MNLGKAFSSVLASDRSVKTAVPAINEPIVVIGEDGKRIGMCFGDGVTQLKDLELIGSGSSIDLSTLSETIEEIDQTERKYNFTLTTPQAYVDCGNLNRFLTNQVTFEALTQIRSFPGPNNNYFIGNYDYTSNRGLSIQLYLAKDIRIFYGDGVNSYSTVNSRLTVVPSPNLVLNDDTHVAIAYDGQDIILFINYKEVFRSTKTVDLNGKNTRIAIGHPTSTTGYPFDGYIKYSRVWNKALSKFELLAGSNRKLHVDTPNMVEQWNMNESSGSIMYGSKGNNGNIVQHNEETFFVEI